MVLKTCARIMFIVLVLVLVISAGCSAKSTPSTTNGNTPTSTQTTASTSTTKTTSTGTSTSTKTTSTKTTSTTAPKPPAQVSGIVYFRDPAVSFPVDAAPSAQAVEGATVSVSGYNIATGADGKYTIPGGVGYQTITVTKDGYIPTQVSWDFASGQSYTFNIGLYKTPPAINPRPGFINGVITWDAGGWLIDYYYKRGLFQPTYTNIIQNAGSNLVTVSDPVFIKEADENHVAMSATSIEGSFWRMMNESEYTTLVKDTHSKGLQFMLWVGVMDEGRTDYNKIIYTDSPRQDSFWDSWFSEYEKYAVQSAAMAEKLGIEYFNLGHDMSYATSKSRFSGGAADCLARWQKLTSAIRSVYHGKLTYFGGLGIITWEFYEDNDYAPGFIELFDAIGMNIQSILPAFNPSINDLKSAVTAFLDRYVSWDRPLFIMIRTPSVDGGTSFETYIEPLLVVNHEADKHAMNLFQQADIYQAFYEVVNARPSGNGQVMGIFPWGYNYLDNYLTTPGKSDGAMAMDKSGNIRGKPAEAVMKFWNFLR
jgi:hypothetical protein